MNTAEKLGEFETRPGVTYATHDSVALAGDLYLPKGTGPFPALVGVHGGGWVQGVRGQFQHWGKYLAARGVALFAISFIALGYLGLKPPTPAYTNAARIFMVFYFGFFFLMPLYTRFDRTKPVPDRVTYHAH